MARIAFIGLGNMGMPMATNLVKAGFDVKAYDINPDSVRQIARTGAVACYELQQLAGCDVYITMLQNGSQVKHVCIEHQAALMNHAPANALFIDCSSIDVNSSREIHQYAKQHHFDSVDAPVSGGIAGAVAATLTIMIGAETQAYQRAKPILSILGKKLIHAGSPGTGQAAKICNNMILGISMAAISEAFVLAKKLGLSQEKLFEISSNASGQCWAMTHYSPVPNLVENVPSNSGYQPGFSAQMMLKDLLLSQAASEASGQKTKLGQTATELYQRFIDSGNGHMDFSAIINMIEQG